MGTHCTGRHPDLGPPPAVADDARDATSCLSQSAAVAELHKGRAELRAVLSARGRGQKDAFDVEAKTEPTEHDLIVERLKRAEKPVPSLYTLSMTDRPKSRLPPTGFFPNRRPATAWSSGRPTTASSNTTAMSSRTGFPESDASDLTIGEDGSSLAGNPLAAVRRRRRQDGDEFSIRNLLRRSEACAECDGDTEDLQVQAARPCTPDVRISTPYVKGNSRGSPSVRRSLTTDASPNFSAVAQTPTYATGHGEVLLLE